jgi:DNA polymerase III epsilon subunit-like protein
MTQPDAQQNPTPNGTNGNSKTNGDNKATKGPMKERKILFLDLETTGLNPGTHEITEIGAVLVTQPDYEVVGTYQTKVMPSHLETATPIALEIGHFDLETWQREAKPLEVALQELAEFSNQAILAGFNLTFDWAFLQTGFNQVNIEDPFYYHRFDVMSAAFAVMYNRKEFSKFSLSECCRFFGVTNQNAHTAFADAQATYEVFVAMMRYQPEDGPAVEKTQPDLLSE